VENEILSSGEEFSVPPRRSRLPLLVGTLVIAGLLVAWLMQTRVVPVDLNKLTLEIPSGWASVFLSEPGWENRTGVEPEFVSMVQQTQQVFSLVGEFEWFGYEQGFNNASMLMAWRIDPSPFFGTSTAKQLILQMRLFGPDMPDDPVQMEPVNGIEIYRATFQMEAEGQTVYYWLASLDGENAHYLLMFGQYTEGSEWVDRILRTIREKPSVQAKTSGTSRSLPSSELACVTAWCITCRSRDTPLRPRRR